MRSIVTQSRDGKQGSVVIIVNSDHLYMCHCVAVPCLSMSLRDVIMYIYCTYDVISKPIYMYYKHTEPLKGGNNGIILYIGM